MSGGVLIGRRGRRSSHLTKRLRRRIWWRLVCVNPLRFFSCIAPHPTKDGSAFEDIKIMCLLGGIQHIIVCYLVELKKYFPM